MLHLHLIKELVNVYSWTDDLVDLVELVKREAIPLNGIGLQIIIVETIWNKIDFSKIKPLKT